MRTIHCGVKARRVIIFTYSITLSPVPILTIFPFFFQLQLKLFLVYIFFLIASLICKLFCCHYDSNNKFWCIYRIFFFSFFLSFSLLQEFDVSCSLLFRVSARSIILNSGFGNLFLTEQSLKLTFFFSLFSITPLLRILWYHTCYRTVSTRRHSKDKCEFFYTWKTFWLTTF